MTRQAFNYPHDDARRLRGALLADAPALLGVGDPAAAIEAHRWHPSKVVTVSMDKVEFKQPVFTGDLVSFFTETKRVGRSSITVHVSVWAERRFGGGSAVHVTEADVTMVAVDDNFKPTPVLRPNGPSAS